MNSELFDKMLFCVKLNSSLLIMSGAKSNSLSLLLPTNPRSGDECKKVEYKKVECERSNVIRLNVRM